MIISFGSGMGPAFRMSIGPEFEILEYEEVVVVKTNNTSKIVFPEENKASVMDGAEEEFWSPKTKIIRTGEEIYVHAIGEDLVNFVQMDTWDPYESFAKVRFRNDFIWKHDGSKWNIALNANVIEKTPFGYYIDSTYLIEGESDLDYVDPGSWSENMSGEACFVDRELRKLPFTVTNYYSCKQVDGHEELYVIQYGDAERPELSAVVSIDGRIAVEACSFSIEGNTLTYSPCSEEGFGGPLINENGDQVFRSIDLK